MSAAPGRILVADDDGMLRDIATAMLENAGFTVETVGSSSVSGSAPAACAGAAGRPAIGEKQ